MINDNYTYRNSNLCESNGVDVITKTNKGLVGFQRKTLQDLKASLLDGRLYRELPQMMNSQILTRAFIIIEFNPALTTTTGTFLEVDFPRKNYLSLLTKFQLLNIGYFQSSNLPQTLLTILQVTSYISSSNATDLKRVNNSKDVWGRSTHTDYMEFLVQSFPGVGPKLAHNIVTYFGGQLPLMWVIDEKELMNIPGVGPSLAHKLYSFFNISEEVS